MFSLVVFMELDCIVAKSSIFGSLQVSYALTSAILLLIINSGKAKDVFDSPLSMFDGWWFIQSYLIVMLLSPLLNVGIREIPQKTFAYLVWGVFILQYGVQWYHCANAGPSFQKFIITYIIGAYLGKYPIRMFERHHFILLCISSVFLFALPIIVCLADKPSLLK